MTTRQRMIDVLTGIAYSDDNFTKDRIEAASIVLSHSYGDDEEEQAPADEAPATEPGPFFYDTSGWLDFEQFPRKIVIGDVECQVADPFPWLKGDPSQSWLDRYLDTRAESAPAPETSPSPAFGGIGSTMIRGDFWGETAPPKPAPVVEVNDAPFDGVRIRVDGATVGYLYPSSPACAYEHVIRRAINREPCGD